MKQMKHTIHDFRCPCGLCHLLQPDAAAGKPGPRLVPRIGDVSAAGAAGAAAGESGVRPDFTPSSHGCEEGRA
jgi:hypothetical protein